MFRHRPNERAARAVVPVHDIPGTRIDVETPVRTENQRERSFSVISKNLVSADTAYMQMAVGAECQAVAAFKSCACCAE